MDNVMLWAASTLCLYGSFRAGKITIPTTQGFDPHTHLAWGDVETDQQDNPSMVKVYLKRSETDQFGKGVDVFVGHTGNDLCPVKAIRSSKSNSAVCCDERCQSRMKIALH